MNDIIYLNALAVGSLVNPGQCCLHPVDMKFDYLTVYPKSWPVLQSLFMTNCTPWRRRANWRLISWTLPNSASWLRVNINCQQYSTDKLIRADDLKQFAYIFSCYKPCWCRKWCHIYPRMHPRKLWVESENFWIDWQGLKWSWEHESVHWKFHVNHHAVQVYCQLRHQGPNVDCSSCKNVKNLHVF